MKHKRLTVLFCLACLCLVAGVLAACRQSVLTLEKIEKDGYNCEVIFDLAGGTSGNDDRARTELHQYVQSGSPIIKPGTDKNGYSGEAPVKTGYTLGGYYTGTKDGEGNITYDKKWDFKKDRVTESLTLYAYWRENYTIAIHYGENYEETATVTVDQDEDGVAQQVTPSIAGHTVIGYFGDRATAESALADPNAGEGHADELRLTFPVTPTDKFSEENKVWEIYANALEGNFRIVRTKAQFQFSDGTNIYLMTDIDYEQTRISFPNDYSGKFFGNGHTISNFRIERTTTARRNAYLGLFNSLKSTAHLENITFENFELDVSTTTISARYNNYIGALAGRAEMGATLNGVVLKGKMSYSFVNQDEGKELVYNNTIADKAEGFADTGYDCTGVIMEDRSASEN